MTNSTGPLRTPIQTPLWAKYWSLVARTGALPWGSPQRSPPRSPVGGSFWCSGTFCCYRPGPHRIFLKMYGRYWLSTKGFCPRRGRGTCSRMLTRNGCLFAVRDMVVSAHCTQTRRDIFDTSRTPTLEDNLVPVIHNAYPCRLGIQTYRISPSAMSHYRVAPL